MSGPPLFGTEGTRARVEGQVEVRIYFPARCMATLRWRLASSSKVLMATLSSERGRNFHSKFKGKPISLATILLSGDGIAKFDRTHEVGRFSFQ